MLSLHPVTSFCGSLKYYLTGHWNLLLNLLSPYQGLVNQSVGHTNRHIQKRREQERPHAPGVVLGEGSQWGTETQRQELQEECKGQSQIGQVSGKSGKAELQIQIQPPSHLALD